MKKVVIKETKTKEKKVNKPVVRSIDMKEFIAYYKGESDKAIGDRNRWEDNQTKWFKKRFGIRPPKTFPWIGASNQHLPMQDKQVRKTKPIYVGVLDNAIPKVDMMPVGGEDVELSEKLSWHFDWLLRVRMKIFAAENLAADKTLGKGFCIAKVIYTNKTEPVANTITRAELMVHADKLNLLDPNNLQEFITILKDQYEFDDQDPEDQEKMKNIVDAFYNGAEAVEFTLDEEVYNAPEVIILDPEKVVVPSDTLSIFDLEGARFIDHLYDQSVEDFKADVLSGKWDKERGISILRAHGIEDLNDPMPSEFQGEKGKQTQLDQEKKKLSGISYDKEVIKMHEVSVWFDSDGDGKPERWILDYCEDDMDGELRFIRYPYDFMKKWHFVKIPYEIKSEEHYDPRGQVEMINPLASSVNIQHNQKINRQTLGTAFMFWYVPGKVNPDNINFIPGQGIPVSAPGNQNFGVVGTGMGPDVSFEREEQILKAWAEEYMGSTDFGLASMNNPGSGKARTAYELRGIQENSQTTQRLDVNIWKKAWAEVYDRVYMLWVRLGPDKVWTALDESGKPRELTKSEMSYHYNIVPAGDITTTNPELEAAKATMRYDRLIQNPYSRKYQLTRDMVAKDDPRAVKRLIMSPEEAKAMDDGMQKQQADQMQMMKQMEEAKMQLEMLKNKNDNDTRLQIKAMDLRIKMIESRMPKGKNEKPS